MKRQNSPTRTTTTTTTTTTQVCEVESPRLRRMKSREVTSRFHDSPISLPGLWPSSSSSLTLGDHLGRDRVDDNAKENRRPSSLGGSTRLRPRGSEVASRYLADSSPRLLLGNKSPATLQRVRSMSLSRTQWSMSPGRSPITTTVSRSSTSSVEKLLNIGLDFFKTKKSSSSSSSSSEKTNQEFRLLYNRLIQWRFANARADRANAKVAYRVEGNLVCVWDELNKMRRSVVLKKIQLQKEKLEIKLYSILQSQINLLEGWGSMERQHLAALSMTKVSLHSVVCKIPLVEGAKFDIPSARIAVREALDLTSSVELISTFFPSAEENVELMSKLAEVVAQEKLLIEECHELLRDISILEIEERSLICGITQMEFQQKYLEHGKRENKLVHCS